jgi:hypothetical protein
VRRFLGRPESRAPLAIAGFLAVPLFFASLMSSALALQKPEVHQWKGCAKGLCTTWHDPTRANTTTVWLWALLPPLLLVLIGWAASRVVRHGFYIPCVAAILLAMAVVHNTATWEAHHTTRFPWGVDLLPATNNSSNFDAGQWEETARDTALSFEHFTIVIALLCAAIVAALALKRRYFGRGPVLDGGDTMGVHAPDATAGSMSVE